MTGALATASHLRPVGKAAPPRPSSFESITSRIDALGPEVDRAAQRRVAAVGPVVVEALRVDVADAAQEAQAPARRTAARRRRAGSAVGLPPSRIAPSTLLGRRAAQAPLAGRIARARDKRRRRLLAEAEARAPQPAAVLPFPSPPPGRGPSPASAQSAFRSLQSADDVVADVGHARRALAPARTCRRRTRRRRPRPAGRQPPADVVEGALADPAHPALHRVERGQQQVAPRPRRVASPSGATVGARAALRPLPARAGRSEHGVDRSPLRRATAGPC